MFGKNFIFYWCLMQVVQSWKIFHLGRSTGGNLGKPPVTHSVRDINEEWFIQKLDHFNPTDNRLWKQRYFTNGQFFNASTKGPAFLMIGGEGEINVEWMTNGAWIDYAKQFGALCFQLEHRYYGKSHPTSDLSTKNLQFLTSQQALADLATFITAMNEKYKLPSETRWIAFGGSYPGSLAAWLRAKYPHLVHAAVSSSGPLLAEVDFRDYFKVVNEALNTYNEECLPAVQSATQNIEVLLKHLIGQRTLTKLFNLCDPLEDSIKNASDISNFFETLAGNFAGVVQYNKDNRIGKSAKAKNITIETLCDIMVNESQGPPVNRLAAVNNLILKTYDQKCLDFKYDNMISDIRNVTWSHESAEGGRQWTYQTCVEFGFFQTSSYQPQVFGERFPVDFFIQQCRDIFGPKYDSAFLDAAVDRTNTFYGALNVEVTNVVFVHGSIDPWHSLGITKTLNQGAPAIFINGTAHCANMYPAASDDLPGLKAARVEIAQLIDSWLQL